jgi:hypothetical protein|tara:strand:+ start:2497 stop:3594 length:1098 start_codon:yes stop_codon:yes gene_type:complete
MRIWLLILLSIPAFSTEIGEISELKGNGEITRVNSSETFTAELDSDIFSFDDVRTGNGRLAIEFLDDSVVKLTEHSKLIIDEYIFDPDPSKSKMSLQMASGTARFISGAFGKINKENITINTPTATIGIRGTDFTTTVDELGRSLVILLPDKNGDSSGEITVTTAAGVEILNEPFQATMVSAWEQPPTQAVTLANMTLGLIDNMLIVQRPDEVEQAVEEQQAGTSPTADLDKDFFEDAPDLDCDALVEDCGEDKEVTRLDIDLLGIEFLVDLLALMETSSKRNTQTSELNGVELEGIIAGFDPVYQTYTFVEEGLIFFVHEGQNNYDIGIDINAGTYLYINNAGVILEVNINGAGDNVIIINQSP